MTQYVWTAMLVYLTFMGLLLLLMLFGEARLFHDTIVQRAHTFITRDVWSLAMRCELPTHITPPNSPRSTRCSHLHSAVSRSPLHHRTSTYHHGLR